MNTRDLDVVQGMLARERLSIDAALMRDATFGMFDPQVWAKALTQVAERRVDKFEVTPETRPALRAHLATVIEAIIDEVEDQGPHRPPEPASQRVHQ